MKTIDTLLCGVALFALIGSVSAAGPAARPKAKDEEAVLAQLKKLYPATTFNEESKSPTKGLYEVVMGSNIVYVDATGRHFLFGHLFDMQTQSDLTAMRQPGGASSSPPVAVEKP